jgi:hypothetical protein
VSSPCTHRFFPRILQIRLNTFLVPGDNSVYQNNPNLPYSPYTLKYYPCILRVRRKNEEYAERNFHFPQCLGTLKGQYFENRWDEQFTNFIFWISLKKLLCTYTENTLNGKISTESVYISGNNNTNI